MFALSPPVLLRNRCLVLMLGFVVAVTPTWGIGQELREATSLRFVGEDVGFYATFLRNREQWEIFLASNTFTRLRNLPLLTFGLTMLESQWNEPTNEALQVLKQLWEQEENRQLAQVALDAVSQEVFLVGDAQWPRVMQAAQDLQRAMRRLQVRAARAGESDEDTEKELLALLGKTLEGWKTPGLMVGFKVTDPAAAEAQLVRLEKLLREQAEGQEDLQPLAERLQRETISGSSFLVLRLDGSLIPWDELPESSPLRDQEELQDAFKKLQATVGIGVHQGYLLFLVGQNLDELAKWGQGKLLADRSELSSLKQFADRRMVSVGYVSQAFAESANSTGGQLDDLVATVETLLPVTDLSDEDSEAILKDAREFAAELKNSLPKSGALATFSFLTDRGYEGYTRNWGENKLLDASKPLTILDHVGGDPIGFAVGRGAYHPESYDFAVRWAERAWNHAVRVMEPRLNEEERERFEKLRERLLPLVQRVHRATRDNLIPSLRDGQLALILDAKARSKQWQNTLPATRVALPMLEPAMVCGVSDQDAMKEALKEYLEVTREALAVLHDVSEGKVPRVDLPDPGQESVDGATIYSYPIPAEAGLDSQLAPNLGLSSDTAVLSAFPAQTRRLLQRQPVKRVGVLEAAAGKPLAGASYFRIAGVLDALTPWINYGVRLAGQAGGEQGNQAQVAAQMVAGNVTPIAEILKSLGEYSSVTYLEDGAWVTHASTQFQDGN